MSQKTKYIWCLIVEYSVCFNVWVPFLVNFFEITLVCPLTCWLQRLVSAPPSVFLFVLIISACACACLFQSFDILAETLNGALFVSFPGVFLSWICPHFCCMDVFRVVRI